MQRAGHGLNEKNVFSPQRIRAILLIALCAILLLKASIFFFHAARVVIYPFEWSTMDGYYVYFGARLISGLPIYFGYDSLLMPFEYVPLYPTVIGALASIFGPGVWYERSFSLLCSLGTAILVWHAVNRRTRNRRAAGAAALFFFAPAAISVWYIVRGIDLFAVALGLLGAVMVENNGKNSDRRIVLATVVFVLAFYAKQTTVFPAAACIIFVLSRNFKRGILMGAGYSAAVGVVFACFQISSGGWFFESAFLTTSRHPYHFGRLLLFSREFMIWLGPAFIIASIQAIRGASRKPDMWTLYFCLTLVSVLLSGKSGAALSYFVPLFSATCICVGLALGDTKLAERRPRAHVAALLIMVAQAALLFASDVPVPTEKNYEQARLLDAHIKSHPGEILSERIDSFLVLNGRELNVEASVVVRLIIRERFDQHTIVRAIEDQRFSLIVYSGMYFRGLPDVKRSIFENYKVIDRIDLGLFYGNTLFLVLIPNGQAG